MVGKGIRGGLFHAIYRSVKAKKKHVKDYDKNNGSSCLKYWDANILHGWALSQSFPVNGFEWVDESMKIL